MSLLTVGSVGVKLVPVADRFAADTRAKLRNLNANVTLKVGNENAFRKQIDELVRNRATTIDVDADTAAANAEIDEAARNRDATINVDADTGAAEARIGAVGAAARGPGGIITSILALGPALIPVTAAVAGIGAALTAPLAAATVGGGLFAIFAADSMSRIKQTEKQIKTLDGQLARTTDPKKAAALKEQIDTLSASLTGATGVFSRTKQAFGEAVGAFEKKNDKSILGPLTTGMKILMDVLPTLTPLIKAMGSGLTLMFKSIGKGLKSDGFGHFISVLASIAGPLFAALGPVIVNIGKGFASLVEAVLPMTGHGFTQGLIRVSEGFANIGQSKGFQSFLGYVRKEGPKVWEFVKQLGGAVVNLVKALAPFGSVALGALSGLAGVLAKINTGALTKLVGTVIAGTLAFKTFSTVTRGMMIIQTVTEMIKGMTVAQQGLNAAQRANVIGLIVTALAALVVGIIYAYNHFKWFHDFVQAVWKGIKTVIKGTVDWFTNTLVPTVVTVFDTIKGAISKAFNWVKDNWPLLIGILGGPIGIAAALIVTHWNTVKHGLKAGWDWISDHVFSPLKAGFRAVKDYFADRAQNIKDGWKDLRTALRNGWTWISDHVFSPLKAGLKGVKEYFSDRIDDLKQLWSTLKSGLKDGWVWISRYVFSPLKSGIGYVKTAFSNAIGTEKAGIKHIWSVLQSLLKGGWDWIDKHVFDPLKKGVGYIKDAFSNAKKGIAQVWGELKSAVAKPVKFIVNTVYTDGIQHWWNLLAKAVHIKGINLPDVKLGFAGGGVMPGYTPGRDVHQFYSPTAGRLDLSGGEAIMRPEWTRAVGGPRAVAQMNAAAKSGRAFKDGGVIDNITDWLGSTWSKTWHGVLGHFGNPLAALSKVGGGDFGKIVSALPRKAVDGLKDTLKGLFSGGGKGGGGKPGSLGSLGGGAGSWTGPGLGWKKMWALVSAAVPGLTLTSAFRPGAIAAGTGLPSMHSVGRAIDVGGSPLAMHMAFQWIKQHFPNSKEIIHSQEGINQVYKGRPFLYPEPTRSEHFNHTHWGYAQGGVLPALARGGQVTRSGLAVVGERGAEVVDLPAGATVHPHGSGPRGIYDGLTINVRDERTAIQELEAMNRRAAIRSGLSRR